MSDLRTQLESVRTRFGRLTPAHVVEAARPEDAPLHARFEWDDSIAAEKWRREQAAELIRSYRITYAKNDDGPRNIRGYIAIRPEDDASVREYLPTGEVMVNPIMRRIVLRDLERDLSALKAKYGHLKEYTDLLLREAQAA